jgi:hypothetical protein
VRGYDIAENLTNDLVDDVISTGQQREVSEGDRPADERARQEQSIDDLRQSQILPGSRWRPRPSRGRGSNERLPP